MLEGAAESSFMQGVAAGVVKHVINKGVELITPYYQQYQEAKLTELAYEAHEQQCKEAHKAAQQQSSDDYQSSTVTLEDDNNEDWVMIEKKHTP